MYVPAAAFAHQSSLVYSTISARGRSIDATLQISNADLYEALGLTVDRPVTKDELAAGRARLLDYVAQRVRVASSGATCAVEPRGVDTLDKADGFFALVKLSFDCHRTSSAIAITYDLFFDLDPRHQGIARIELDDAPAREHIFRAAARTLDLSRPVTLFDHLRDYLRLGVEHIFTGYDHLAFLIGLLLAAVTTDVDRRRLVRGLVAVVTSFTAAHSLTLIAAALGWFALPTWLVEPAIAASIVYVAVENLLRRAPAHRWRLTFAFGLIHGFGFASVLREIGLPERGVVASLLAFNVGVELGQLVGVTAALPVLLLASARLGARRLRVGGSIAVGLAGLYWLGERLYYLSKLG